MILLELGGRGLAARSSSNCPPPAGGGRSSPFGSSSRSERLAERSEAAPEAAFAATHRACCGAVALLYIPAQSALESAAQPDETNGFMLRGIHKASANWLGRAVMGVRARLLIASASRSGASATFSAASAARRGQGRQHRDPARARSASSTRTGCSSSAARSAARSRRPGPRARPRPAVAAASSWPRPRSTSGRGAGAQCLGRRDRPHASPTIPASKGATASSTARASSSLRNDRLHRSAVRRRAAAAHRCASSSSSIVGGDAAGAESRAGSRPTASRTRSARIEYVMLGRRRRATSRRRRRRSSPSISRSARSCSARRNTARSRRGADAEPIWRSSDRDFRRRCAESATTRPPVALRARRSGGIIQQIVFPTWRRPRPRPTSSLRTARRSRRWPPSAGSRTATSISAPSARPAVVDRAVADAAFALKEGEVSAPVQGALRHRASSSVEDRARQDRPFEEVAADVKRDIAARARQGRDHRTCTTRSRTSALGGATLADAARKFNLTPRTIEAIDRTAGRQAGNAGRRPAAERRCAVRGVRRRCRRRERAAAGAQQRRLRLVRRDGDHAGARPHARRSQGRGRARAGATTRSPTRLTDQGRPRCWTRSRPGDIVRGRCRGRAAQVECRGRASSAAAADGALARPSTRDLQDAAKAGRRRAEGASADRTDRVSRDRDQGAAARSRRPPTPSASTKRCATRIAEDLIAQYHRAAAKRDRRQRQSRAR